VKRAVIALLLGLALGAGGLAALADPPRAGFAPDPPTPTSRKQWSIEVVARGGKVTVGGAKAMMLEKPAESPRVMGRFALEFYVGPQLLDRVRFNLPLLDAPPEHNRGPLRRPSFEQVNTRLQVRIADSPRAAYLLLVDRATGETQRFAWPPEANGNLLPWKTGSLSDAGPGDFPGAGVKLLEVKDGGAAEGGPAEGGRGPAGPRDAGRD
jgi:hypothetical protein